MEFRILGPLEALSDGRPLAVSSGQQRTLLALLIVNANRVLSPDRIVDEVWADRLPGSGTKALAFHVSRLRDALAPGRPPGAPAGGLETEAGGYVLRVEPGAIDAVRFERLAIEAHGRLTDDPAGARATLVEALGLWRGDALTDVAYADFAQAEIRRLNELRLAALEDRLEADLALGRHLVVIAELESLLAANPMRDRLRGLLMLALYRSGRQAEALRAAGAGRRLLSEELGIDPSPELLQLEARILAQDDGLMLPAAAAPGLRARQARNPYKGLRAFGETDSADFFGREALVGRLVARLEEVAHAGRLLTVVGPSGSGKSSVVRAGLIPAVRARPAGDGGPWIVATMVPGVAPFHELAACLAAAGHPIDPASVARAERSGELGPLVAARLATGEGRLLLVIDQLEELFVRVDETTRLRFLGGLVAVLKKRDLPVVVVMTLRADFLHVPLLTPELGELIREGIELVTPLTRSEVERAVVRPAEAVGVAVEPALVAAMTSDVEHRPGALPLLQYALTELFDRSDGRRLTRDGYEAIGGALGALGRRADEAWQGLDAEGRDVAQQVLLGLVAFDGGVATARPVPRAELESLGGEPGRVAGVLDDLGRRGLLTFDVDHVTGAATVQIAHEALLAHWSRLADWIEDLREDLWSRRRLADAALEWEDAGRSPGFLAAGSKLDRFESWSRTTRLRLTDLERTFLAASVGERARLAEAETERIARERRLERRSRLVRRALAGVLVAAIVLASTLSVALLREQQSSAEQSAIASARELAAVSTANLGRSRLMSVLLALEAAQATTGRGYVTDEAYDALQWALQEAQVPYPAGALPVGVRTAPDGARGTFLVAPEVLMRLGSDYVKRQLTSDECRTYLHATSCPAASTVGNGLPLGVRTGGGIVPAASLASGALSGARVRVLSELPADVAPLTVPFERETGIKLDWDATGGNLAARIAAGDLPDVAVVSRPAYVAAAAHDGWLVDLTGRVDTTSLAPDAGTYAMTLGELNPPGVSGRYGIPLAASVDDLLWYPKDAFAAAGYTPPATLAELDALVARLHAAGRVPWCLGNEAGTRTGSASAAWVEDLLLGAQGPAVYDRWTNGQLEFGSTQVREAFEVFGNLVMGPGDVLDGLNSVNLISDRIAALPLVRPEGPECWLYRGSSTDLATFPPGWRSRAAAVPFPGGQAGAQLVLGRLYMVVVLHDRPEVRRLVEALTAAPFASAMVTAIGDRGIFPVRDVALPTDPTAAAESARLRAGLSSGSFRVRAVDLLPEPVAQAFLNDVAGYVQSGVPSTAGIDFGADLAWHEPPAGATP